MYEYDRRTTTFQEGKLIIEDKIGVYPITDIEVLEHIQFITGSRIAQNERVDITFVSENDITWPKLENGIPECRDVYINTEQASIAGEDALFVSSEEDEREKISLPSIEIKIENDVGGI